MSRISENGHVGEGMGNHRCWNCAMKYNYYEDIKRALKEQPDREYLKKLIKCEKKGEKKKE